MATAHFYIIHIVRDKTATYEQVEEKMNLANDWYRLKSDLWIVYSTSDEEKWYSRLGPLAKETGSLFICKLDPTARQGWMENEFWAWMRRETKPNK